jgi:hypothetical protein
MSNTAAGQNHSTGTFWSMRREATLNWLALGLLLAAWNASDRDASDHDVDASARRRPEALRRYSHVSVRAANRLAGIGR